MNSGAFNCARYGYSSYEALFSRGNCIKLHWYGPIPLTYYLFKLLILPIKIIIMIIIENMINGSALMALPCEFQEFQQMLPQSALRML